MKSPRGWALQHARVFDGTSESYRDGEVVVLADAATGRLLAVGPPSQVPIPPDFEVVDLSGRFIIPGLINAHCHLFGNGRPKKIVRRDKLLRAALAAVRRWPFRALLKAQMRRSIEQALNAGVTTLRCVGDPWYLDVEVRRDIEASPEVPAPRLLVAGMGICVTGGHACALSQECDSPWEVRRAVRRNVHEGVDLIKVFATGGAMDSRRAGEAGRPQMTEEEIAAACDEAHRAGYPVAAHVQSTQGLREALRAGVDSIEHGAEIGDDVIDLFTHNPRALHGHTALVVTLSPVVHILQAGADAAEVSASALDNIAVLEGRFAKGYQRALREGIRVGVGSDAAMPLVTHYDFWRELLYLTMYGGISPARAILMATRENAEILGISDETGCLAAGRAADLVVLEQDPLRDLRALARPASVMARGRMVQTASVRRFEDVERLVAPLAGDPSPIARRLAAAGGAA